MAKVWVYPQREWRELGESRYTVSTDVVKPMAMGKDEIDIDEDLLHPLWGLPTKAKADAFAAKLLKRTDLAFGAVYIQKQEVGWFVQEDRIAEWKDVGESEEVTA